MTKRKFFKKKLIFAFLVIFLFTLGLALWQPQPPSISDEDHQVFSLMENALGEKGEIILNKDQINALLKKEFNEDRIIGNLKIKDIGIDMKKEELILHVPIVYRGLSFTLTSRGSIHFEQPYIYYRPNKVMVGKLPIPKSFLLSTIEKQDSEHFTIEEGKIKIDKSILPLSISYIAVKDGQLHVALDKEGKIQWALQFLDLEEKEKEKVENILGNVLEDLDKIKEILEENNQKDVIDRIQKSIENMIKNPDDHSQKDIEDAKKSYGTLPPKQQKEVMSAILSGVDTHTLLMLKEEFGF
ncbi:hypothetical protein NSA47_04780 [Irregularibacter muris]|uniref:Uncharacterized protein n=1 Tax=Irregularibacter muris TaxID=1796619 RepID=A0AAE3HFR5_9FIRM|nr:hypothetical protein [Irregularibacter muris]MCR1898303.1 hypothetical protein [Irregularibacter muris]